MKKMTTNTIYTSIMLVGLAMCLCSVTSFAAEIVEITLFDGEKIKGKLSLPEKADKIKEIVIYVHGTGPNTFLNHRKIGNIEFDYFGTFADEFTKKGIAFFSYNRRGVDTLSTAPFEKINREKFKKYVPPTEAKDVSAIIQFLKKDKRLKRTKIILLGWSEGSIIASMVAEDKKNKVTALFLAGYVHDRMDDVIKWQYSGVSSIRVVAKYFDADSNQTINRIEYESNSESAVFGRTKALKNAKFVQLDANKDSLITSEDFGMLSAGLYKNVMDAYEKRDDEWIWKNYFKVTTAWMQAHFELEPNKMRLLAIKIPIYIFHGEDDANCDVEGVYDLAKLYAQAGKTNLQYFIFKNHDHNLNFMEWIVKKNIPEGIRKMIETAEKLNK